MTPIVPCHYYINNVVRTSRRIYGHQCDRNSHDADGIEVSVHDCKAHGRALREVQPVRISGTHAEFSSRHILLGLLSSVFPVANPLIRNNNTRGTIRTNIGRCCRHPKTLDAAEDGGYPENRREPRAKGEVESRYRLYRSRYSTFPSTCFFKALSRSSLCARALISREGTSSANSRKEYRCGPLPSGGQGPP